MSGSDGLRRGQLLSPCNTPIMTFFREPASPYRRLMSDGYNFDLGPDAWHSPVYGSDMLNGGQSSFLDQEIR
jgi:hypothetical protein